MAQFYKIIESSVPISNIQHELFREACLHVII